MSGKKSQIAEKKILKHMHTHTYTQIYMHVHRYKQTTIGRICLDEHQLKKENHKVK